MADKKESTQDKKFTVIFDARNSLYYMDSKG